jgi:hypothetical protein
VAGAMMVSRVVGSVSLSKFQFRSIRAVDALPEPMSRFAGHDFTVPLAAVMELDER